MTKTPNTRSAAARKLANKFRSPDQKQEETRSVKEEEFSSSSAVTTNSSMRDPGTPMNKHKV